MSVADRKITFAQCSKQLDELLKSTTQKMEASQSVEELTLRHDEMKEYGILLLNNAREVADTPLAELYYNVAKKLSEESNTIYKKHKASLPKTTQIFRRALWPSAGLGIATMGISISLLIPGAPFLDIIFGIMMSLYSTQVLQKKINQPLRKQEETPFRWANALAGFGLTIAGGLTLSGIGTPLALWIIALMSCPPLLIEAASRVKVYYDTKKIIKHIPQNITHLPDNIIIFNDKNSENLAYLLTSIPNSAASKTSQLIDSHNIENLFIKKPNFIKEIREHHQQTIISENITFNRDTFNSQETPLPDLLAIKNNSE